MRSLWSDAAAAEFERRYATRGVGADLALRTYTSRLLGSVPSLVMHGGGNTSVKTRLPDLFGEAVEVLCVKGSGRDLATIEPDGHPAVRLAPLHRLRALDRLSDADMVNVQRQNLLDTAAPNPSVETLLHAFLPHKFVDHTHAVVSTAIAAQPDAAALCERVFHGRVGFVPYVMPGFALAKASAEAFERDPSVEGLLLAHHGIFSFAAGARASYELMIEFVTLMERHVAERARPVPGFASVTLPPEPARAAALLPVIRGVLAASVAEDAPSFVLHLRAGDRLRRFTDGTGLADYATRGNATPEQVIRIKRTPLLAPMVPAAGAPIEAWRTALTEALEAFVTDYARYFAAGNARVGGDRRALDPIPRAVAIPGLGLVGVGRSAADAAINADMAEAWAEAVLDAEAVGRFGSISEADHFDMEYWPLEQAKLGRERPKPFAGRVVLVTGAAGAIGQAIARLFRAEGADVVLLDRDGGALDVGAASFGPHALVLRCDVTERDAVERVFDAVAERFGGLDVVVSNAGAAWSGAMHALDDGALRDAFELNFFAHQHVARAAVRLFRAQRTGGALLFNASKQAINPGPDWGAYGTSKAALLALVRQYAIEHGADGIRVNAVNPDRIRSGLLDADTIRARAAVRGVSEDGYMRGNLLGAEVRAEDVARAFVVSALLRRTTGNILTVDGGNAAAMLR